MEMEEVTLYDSCEKLSVLTNELGDPELAVQKYLSEIKFEHKGDFKQGLEWCNVSEPLSFSNQLNGKIVVLDFFTYCCINCMHILPDLKKLEVSYPIEDGVVIIGVHSPKFLNEKDSANILSAVQRYNIEHPVVNDESTDMWNKYDISCWPTLLIMDPNGKPIIMFMGEGHYNNINLFLKHALSFYKSKNLIKNHSLPIKLASHLLPDRRWPVLFPGKIATIQSNSTNDTLAISDSGNNRVLIVINGVIKHIIGGSKAGMKNGTFEEAEFNQPQGIAFQNANILFIADTENHLIRKVDFKNKLVTTVAGNGTQSEDNTGGKIGINQGISSPWDLAIYKTHDLNKNEGDLKDVLIIAMAGLHQIWALFLDDIVWWKDEKYKAGTVVAIAGSGKEENRNNQYPRNAAFAQPSGLAISKKSKELYIADSESSSIRRLSLSDGKVTAVVGGDRDPNNLFAFGDCDGTSYNAKLQHALGLTLSTNGDFLFVADTYNHKIKKVDLSKNSITTLKLPSENAKEFSEPSGLCTSSDGKKIYVTDTNNHKIKILHLTPEQEIEKVELLNMTAKPFKGEPSIILENNEVYINSNGAKITIYISFELIGNIKFTANAGQAWTVLCTNPKWILDPTQGKNLDDIGIEITIPKGEETETIMFYFNLITCSTKSCMTKNFCLKQPVSYSKDGVERGLIHIVMSVSSNKVKLV